VSGILVHEWLSRTGGSENVFESLSEVFPSARRYCLWNESGGRFEGVKETWLARTPLKGRKVLALPLMPLAWRTLPSEDAEWLLCSSHLFAHHARFAGPARGAPKLVYVHTPARYIWVPELDGRGAGPVARAAASALKSLDRRRASEPLALAANSRFVADRIAGAWGREATVIHPPVDSAAFLSEARLTEQERSALEALPTEFVLGFSRFIPYKRLDLVIEAGAAAGLPVVLAGAGPEEQRLRDLAEERYPGRVFFVVGPSTEMYRALQQRALVLVFPPIEDFGIVPVEAMAAGTPVVANTLGGTAESVRHGETGALTADWSRAALRDAIATALAANPDACRARAADFSAEVFAGRIRSWVAEHAAVVP